MRTPGCLVPPSLSQYLTVADPLPAQLLPPLHLPPHPLLAALRVSLGSVRRFSRVLLCCVGADGWNCVFFHDSILLLLDVPTICYSNTRYSTLDQRSIYYNSAAVPIRWFGVPARRQFDLIANTRPSTAFHSIRPAHRSACPRTLARLHPSSPTPRPHAPALIRNCEQPPRAPLRASRRRVHAALDARPDVLRAVHPAGAQPLLAVSDCADIGAVSVGLSFRVGFFILRDAFSCFVFLFPLRLIIYPSLRSLYHSLPPFRLPLTRIHTHLIAERS